MKILLVDDEKGFVETLKDNLEFEKYKVDCAYGGVHALSFIKKNKYDLILLDVMMPDKDGFEVLKELRKTDKKTPVIFLTARSIEEDKVHGLGLGADDYITKPFSLIELLARIKTILRRTKPGSDISELKIGEIYIDFNKYIIKKKKKEIEISRYEADILKLLSTEPGKLFSRDEIMEKVWGKDVFPTDRTVDNYIAKIRKKIEKDPKNPKFLISIYGVGYKLENL